MLKLDLVARANTDTHLSKREILAPENGDEAAAEPLFEAMRGALRRTDRVNLTGFGFFVVKPRKPAQEAASLLSAMFDSSTDAIIATSLDGKIVEWNRGARAIFGYDAEEVVGSNLSILEPDARFTGLTEALAKLKHGAEAVEIETQSATKSGDPLTLQLTVSAITDRKGRPVAAAILARDVTERRQAEEELRKAGEWFHALVDKSSDVVAVLESDGAIRFINSAVRNLLGCRPDELVGSNPIDRIHGEDLPNVKRAARDCLHHGKRETVRVRVRHFDNSWRTIEATAQNRIDDDAIGGIVVNARDITEQTRRDEQLRKSYGQVQRLEAAEHLAGVIGRDLDNLLTTICGYSDLIISQLPENHHLLPDLQEVKRAGDRAAALSRQLLVFSQRQLLRPRVLNLNSVIEALEPRIRGLAGPQITVVTGFDSEAGRVVADQEQLEQAILNIAANAREAMPHGGTLTIETKNVDVHPDQQNTIRGVNPGRHVMVVLRDSGSGMDPKTQSHLFEPFYSTKGKGSGRGLGLSAAYGIIKQNKGSISVFSEPSAGTSFRIYLPRVDAVEIAGSGTEGELPRGTETILLAQPDDGFRALTRKILVMCGYAVLEARTDTEAQQFCQTHPAPIHLLIADAANPSGGARELAMRLLPHRPEMKMLFTHGHIEDSRQLDTSDSALAYIAKPFSPRALARRVRELLDSAPRFKALAVGQRRVDHHYADDANVPTILGSWTGEETVTQEDGKI